MPLLSPTTFLSPSLLLGESGPEYTYSQSAVLGKLQLGSAVLGYALEPATEYIHSLPPLSGADDYVGSAAEPAWAALGSEVVSVFDGTAEYAGSGTLV